MKWKHANKNVNALNKVYFCEYCKMTRNTGFSVHTI